MNPSAMALRPLPPLAALLAFAALPAAAQSNCDAIAAQIDSRIRAGGVTSFTLRTVDASQNEPGKVVGQCDKGAKKIVYLQKPGTVASSGTAASAAPRPAPRRADDEILTECKDGSMSIGGTCGKAVTPR